MPGEILVDASKVVKCRRYAVAQSDGLYGGKWLCQAHLDWEKELEMESRLDGEAEAKVS